MYCQINELVCKDSTLDRNDNGNLTDKMSGNRCNVIPNVTDKSNVNKWN